MVVTPAPDVVSVCPSAIAVATTAVVPVLEIELDTVPVVN